MLEHLPFDILFSVIQLVTITDILSLRLTCRAMYYTVEQRPVWHAINRDTVPANRWPGSLPGVPVEDLRSRALYAHRLDRRWRHSGLVPRVVQTHPCDTLTRCACIFHGGEWALTLASNGALRLLRVQDSQSFLTVEPYFTKGREQNAGMNLCWSKYYGDVVIVVVQSSNTYGPPWESELRLYSVHTDPPATDLLQVIEGKNYTCHYTLEDDLLIYGSLEQVGPTYNEYRHEIVVMQFCPATQKRGRQVVMNVIEEERLSFDVSVSPLPGNQILVAHNHRMGIFEIPPFPEGDYVSDVVDVTARWSIDFERDTCIRPTIGPVVRHYDNITQVPQCTVLTGRYIRVLKVSLSSCSVVSRLVPDRLPKAHIATVGTRRMIWNTLTTRQVMVTSTFTFSEDVMFGSIDSPLSCFETVQDLAFDEVSGRVCMLVTKGSLVRIVVMDVI